MESSSNESQSRRREMHGYGWSTSVQPEREDRSERRDCLLQNLSESMSARPEGEAYEDSVIELDSRRVLEHIPPPSIGLGFSSGVKVGEEFGSRRDESSTHQRELVVHQSSIESSDKGTC